MYVQNITMIFTVLKKNVRDWITPYILPKFFGLILSICRNHHFSFDLILLPSLQRLFLIRIIIFVSVRSFLSWTTQRSFAPPGIPIRFMTSSIILLRTFHGYLAQYDLLFFCIATVSFILWLKFYLFMPQICRLSQKFLQSTSSTFVSVFGYDSITVNLEM